MMRRKGWCQQYLNMTREEVAAEIRRLERGRGYIYDREAKLAFLRNHHIVAIDAGARPDDLLSPHNITWISR